MTEARKRYMMAIISLIAAVDENRGLGKNNQLLCHLPGDLQYFKKTTLGKPVIMGRKTYESIGKPLAGRFNIVLSHSMTEINGMAVVPTIQQGLDLVTNATEIMVIGGASIYKQALPYASRIYLTLIHHQFNADVFFPYLDPKVWSCKKGIVNKDIKNKYHFTFCYYERNL